MTAEHPRMIDRWFPCGAVDEAVRTPEGSGLSEKAIFTWFASRPIAQARAAVLTSLLMENPSLHSSVNHAIRTGDSGTLEDLRDAIDEGYPDESRPVVLDMFSGRGIIPLESARLGYRTIGLDLSPVATLGGKLLADYPLRDWDNQPDIRYTDPADDSGRLTSADSRLVRDVRKVLAEVGRRSTEAVRMYYPLNARGEYPWGYVWAISITCDGCHRRFPLVGSLVLRHPRTKKQDPGQAFEILAFEDSWRIDLHNGVPKGHPTFAAPLGKRGKLGKCPFCKHVHSLDTIKKKGFSGNYVDELLLVADLDQDFGKVFRLPTMEELAAIERVDLAAQEPFGQWPAVPDEAIPQGNEDSVRGSGYGFITYGSLTNARQTLRFVEVARAIRTVAEELAEDGVSEDYVAALAGYSGALLVRSLKYGTRGTKLRTEGSTAGVKPSAVRTDHIFANESKVSFNLDYCEIGLSDGTSTWTSLSTSEIRSLRKHVEGLSNLVRPATIRRGDATALPLRDNSVDVIVTDPPYGNMIDYSDASDLFFVWLRRALSGTHPDLFGDSEDLQPKETEAIVKRGGGPKEHRTAEGYQNLMEKAFREALRVLRPDGTMSVVFGQADPDAWRYLLTALHKAGFIVTGSWPARTETAATGVASIRVTVTLSCRPAAMSRPIGIASVVENEVFQVIKGRVPGWSKDGLALHDQIMAAYGPAMEVFGSFDKIEKPDGSTLDIDRFLELAVVAVRDAASEPVESLPLETFDALTRFSIFWLRAHGLNLVHKGEARFYAQADNLGLADIKDTYLQDRKKAGYVLSLEDPGAVDADSPVIDVVRGMAAAWVRGASDATAEVLADAERDPNDDHLWAVLAEVSHRLKPSHKIAKATTDILRNRNAIEAAMTSVSSTRLAVAAQPSLLDQDTG